MFVGEGFVVLVLIVLLVVFAARRL